VGKSKLLINCCGMIDVLTYDQNNGVNQANIVHQHQVAFLNSLPYIVLCIQNDDLFAMGRLIVALCCGALQAAAQHNLAQSIQLISQHYSVDLKNLITYVIIRDYYSLFIYVQLSAESGTWS
jgi:hypothetical protein